MASKATKNSAADRLAKLNNFSSMPFLLLLPFLQWHVLFENSKKHH